MKRPFEQTETQLREILANLYNQGAITPTATLSEALQQVADLLDPDADVRSFITQQ